VRKNETAENWHHERVSAALKEAVDPKLKAAMESELRPEDFVFAENQEENADGNAEEREGLGVASKRRLGLSGVWVSWAQGAERIARLVWPKPRKKLRILWRAGGGGGDRDSGEHIPKIGQELGLGP
jgi:hypothetical protein